MTREEFQTLYHRFEAGSREEACEVARAIEIEGDVVVAVGLPFGDQVRWCVMLGRAAAAVQFAYAGKIEVLDPRFEEENANADT